MLKFKKYILRGQVTVIGILFKIVQWSNNIQICKIVHPLILCKMSCLEKSPAKLPVNPTHIQICKGLQTESDHCENWALQTRKIQTHYLYLQRQNYKLLQTVQKSVQQL
jgi:hypothetical protein